MGSITAVAAGVPSARTGQAFRVYAETSGTDPSVQTGVALVNPADSSVPVLFELFHLGRQLDQLNGGGLGLGEWADREVPGPDRRA